MLQRKITVADYERFAVAPANANRILEFICGEVVEQHANADAAAVNVQLSAWVAKFVDENSLGRVFGSRLGYCFGDDRYLPSMTFRSNARLDQDRRAMFVKTPPELVVEVIHAASKPDSIRLKLVNYQLNGVLTWIVDVEKKRIEIYTPGEPPRVLGIDGLLGGGAVLPGFIVPIKDIFSE